MSHHHYEDVIDTSKKAEIDYEINKLVEEKKELEKAEEIKNTKAWDLSVKLRDLKKRKEELDREIIETQLELNKLCTHERIRTENRNYPGGYLDKAEYWTDYFCEICGVKVDEKVEYGGFG